MLSGWFPTARAAAGEEGREHNAIEIANLVLDCVAADQDVGEVFSLAAWVLKVVLASYHRESNALLFGM